MTQVSTVSTDWQRNRRSLMRFTSVAAAALTANARERTLLEGRAAACALCLPGPADEQGRH